MARFAATTPSTRTGSTPAGQRPQQAPDKSVAGEEDPGAALDEPGVSADENRIRPPAGGQPLAHTGKRSDSPAAGSARTPVHGGDPHGR